MNAQYLVQCLTETGMMALNYPVLFDSFLLEEESDSKFLPIEFYVFFSVIQVVYISNLQVKHTLSGILR